MREEWQNFEIIVCIGVSTFNQAFMKTFLVSTSSKTSFLTSTTAVDTQQMSKIQSRLLVKPKIIQSLSACKNHSINLLDSSNH